MALATTDEFVREHDAWTRGIAAGVARELGLRHAMDDLVGYAFAGLVEARERYEPGPVPFQGFAYYRVRGAVLNGAYRIRGLTRRALIAALQAGDERLEEAAQVPVPPAADRNEYALVRLDGFIRAIADAQALAMIADERSGEAEQIAAMDRERIRRAVRSLPDRERTVLEGVYFDELPLDDIGARLGLSRSGTSRLHTRALRQLREALDGPSGAATGGSHGREEAER